MQNGHDCHQYDLLLVNDYSRVKVLRVVLIPPQYFTCLPKNVFILVVA